MQIEEAFRIHKLGIKLDPSDVLNNKWFAIFETDAVEICQRVLGESVSFAFSASLSIQAYALYEARAVVVTAGMFDRLCRLAANVVGKGIYVGVGDQPAPSWQPCTAQSMSAAGTLLSTDTFIWNTTYFPWSKDPERALLFFYVLNTLFRFVLFHELGHIYYRHGKRFSSNFVEKLECDVNGPPLIPVELAIPSQAREIAADNFAFRALVKIQKADLEQGKTTAVAKLLMSKLITNDHGLVTFITTSLYLYFYSMDRKNWMGDDPFLFTHPPAPFRLKTLLASLIDNEILGIPSSEATILASKAYFGAQAIVAVAYDQYPNPQWLDFLEADRYRKLYETIYAELPNWW